MAKWYKVADGVTSVSYAGVQFEVVDGVFEAPDSFEEALNAHGFVPTGKPGKKSKLSKATGTVVEAPVEQVAGETPLDAIGTETEPAKADEGDSLAGLFADDKPSE